VGRTKREQSEATIRLLVDVATQLFAERGYHGVGLEEVARRAQVTRGALYHHFDSKQGLFGVVLERVQQDVAERVLLAASRAPDRWNALVEGCHAFMAATTDHRVRRIMLVDAPSVLGWQQWRQTDAANSARLLEQALLELEDEGTIAPGFGQPAARLLSGAMNEAALWVAESSDGAGNSAAAGVVLDRLLDSLRTSP